jgi:NADP-dependent 3-hydroxy acid dehydrogenase YdfG
MSSFWTGKTVLVTGASSGIGEELALRIGSQGAAVGLMARRKDNLTRIAELIEQGGGRALVLAVDVTDAEAVKAAVAEVYGKWARIDVLIANAGIAATAHAFELDPVEVARVLQTNVLGAVNCVAAVLPSMKARRAGQIVAISSLAAYRGLPKSGAYCASKAAMSSFFESLRIDLRGSGIDVTVIHPGFIETPLTANRRAKMPYLMNLADGAGKILGAIEKKRRSYAFPWQLATIVKSALIFPASVYDRIAARNSFRE